MKFKPMNQRVKRMWLEVLRSGRFSQAQYRLSGGLTRLTGKESFCCLGVLCAIHNADVSPTKSNWARHLYKGAYGTTPEEVDMWAGLPSAAADKLADMNDAGNKTFKQIADWIERNL